MTMSSFAGGLTLAAVWVGSVGPRSPEPPPSPAPMHDLLAAEFQPIDDEITYLRALIAEIERQGQNRVTQLGRWIGWWTKVQALATEIGTDLSKNFDERVENAQKAGAVLGGLINNVAPSQRHLPHLGWQDTVTLANLINTLRQ